MSIVKLKNVRLAFSHPNLFVASNVNGEGEPKFGCTLILPPNHPQLKECEDAATAVAQAKWGAKAPQMIQAMKAQDKWPIHDGASKSQYEGFVGNKFISCRSKKQPLVIGRDRTVLTMQSPILYSGAMVNANVQFWPQDNQKGGKRVNTQVMGVQFFADNDSFGGGGAVSSEDDFADLGVADGADFDPLA